MSDLVSGDGSEEAAVAAPIPRRRRRACQATREQGTPRVVLFVASASRQALWYEGATENAAVNHADFCIGAVLTQWQFIRRDSLHAVGAGLRALCTEADQRVRNRAVVGYVVYRALDYASGGLDVFEAPCDPLSFRDNMWDLGFLGLALTAVLNQSDLSHNSSWNGTSSTGRECSLIAL